MTMTITELLKFLGEMILAGIIGGVIVLVINICMKKNKMDEWISVKDRLPEEGSYVLVFVNFGYGYTIGTSQYLNNNFKMDENITHWMPLPKPPKGE